MNAAYFDCAACSGRGVTAGDCTIACTDCGGTGCGPQMPPEALQHAHRSAHARGLTDEQVASLLAHSIGECQQCGERAAMYLQSTAGFDPTIWHLCAAHHPNPSGSCIALDEGFAYFLKEPAGPTYALHNAAMHEGGW